MSLSRALQALHARSERMHALLRALVEQNSHSQNVEGVNRVGARLVAELSSLPLSLRTEVAPSGVKHLVFSSQNRSPCLLLIGHHDTVFPQGTFEGFQVEGDVARGPGVLDMKGGLAMIVSVLHALHEVGMLEALPLTFACVADEEIGSPSSQALLRALAGNARAALVFEAGRAGDAVITSRRGSGSAVVEAHGKAAHAGNNLREGRSAIRALAQLIETVEREQANIRGASASVGLIRGGSARNTVPQYARAELDLRFSDPQGQDALLALLEQARSQALAGTRIEVHTTISRQPWVCSKESSELAARYGEHARLSGLQFRESNLIGGGSDACTVGALGLPTLDGLGPRGQGFHTHEEWIELSSLSKKAEALLRLIVAELQAALH